MKKRVRVRLRKFFYYFGERKIRCSVRKARIRKLLIFEYNYGFVFDEDILQIILIRDQFLEKEDYYSFDKFCFFRLFEREYGRKQKIYEIDEFIDYLLNYY